MTSRQDFLSDQINYWLNEAQKTLTTIASPIRSTASSSKRFTFEGSAAEAGELKSGEKIKVYDQSVDANNKTYTLASNATRAGTLITVTVRESVAVNTESGGQGRLVWSSTTKADRNTVEGNLEKAYQIAALTDLLNNGSLGRGID